MNNDNSVSDEEPSDSGDEDYSDDIKMKKKPRKSDDFSDITDFEGHHQVIYAGPCTAKAFKQIDKSYH